MKPYHSNNLRLQPYSHKRVVALAWMAKLLGVQFSIAGIPFGAAKARDENALSQVMVTCIVPPNHPKGG